MDNCEGNVIEDEPRCDANENGKHDYALIRKWASHDSSLFKHQCRACRIVRVEEYMLTEILCCRRFEDLGRWLQVNE